MKKTEYIIRLCLISLYLLIFTGTMNSQNFGDCGYTDELEPTFAPTFGCEYQSDAWLNKYRLPGYWIPDENTPIKTILVNYIVCLKDDGSGGWVDSPEFRDQVDLMFQKLNEWYSNSIPKGYSLTCEPDINYITDTRIRFELNEIIFINNSSFHVALNPSPIFDWLEEHHLEYKKAPDTSLKSAELNGNTGMNENGGGLTVSARPNPASNTVTFSYVLPDSMEKAVLKLYNTSGRLIYKRILHNDEYEFTYNCSHLNRGVYYYFVSTHDDKVSGKLVIVR